MSIDRPVPELTASDVMTREPVCAEPHMDIKTLARLLEEAGASGCPVVDRQGRVCGVVSRADLLHACIERAEDYAPSYYFEFIRSDDDDEQAPDLPEPDLRVEDFMSDSPIVVAPETPLARIAGLMNDARVHRVVVVDADRMPLGIITSLDIVRVVAQSVPARS